MEVIGRGRFGWTRLQFLFLLTPPITKSGKSMTRILLLSALLATPLVAATPSGHLLRITGIEKPVGSMAIAVFTTKENFLKDAIHTDHVPIPDGATSIDIRLPGSVAGAVAISVFHDLDDDEELDTRIFGMPAEPYGFSKDPTIRFGPPSFRDCRIDLSTQEGPIVIPLR